MPENTFSTSDIYVASLLRTAGVKFLAIRKDGPRGFFIFEDSPAREKLVVDFFNGEAVLNVRQYVDHWMNFKKLVESL
jgi:hypothetical protein